MKNLNKSVKQKYRSEQRLFLVEETEETIWNLTDIKSLVTFSLPKHVIKNNMKLII